MARVADRQRARALRAEGKSYSEIKAILGISKGTLSPWLRDMPLSKEQLMQLRDKNPIRIEHYRETMRKKREARLNLAYLKAKKDIGKISKRELFIAGLYLYWGEGTKADCGAVGIANTDPAVIRAFLDWCDIADIDRLNIRVRLHLYADMNIEEEIGFWSKQLKFNRSQFRKPYIKTSTLTGLTYKNGYGHGTCTVRIEKMERWEYITMALQYLRDTHTRP